MDDSYYQTYTTTSTSSDAASGAGMAIFAVIYIAALVVSIVALWRLFTKAGHPGWKAIVPIYNIYIMCKIVGRPGWWTILFFIPIVNIVISVFISLDLAKAFDRSPAFGVLALWLFGPIGHIILAFDKSTYDASRLGDQAPANTPSV